MDTKSIFTSKTFWGSVVSLLGQFLPHLFVILGFTNDPTGQASLVGWIVSIIGFLLAVIGRFTAKVPVSLMGGRVPNDPKMKLGK